MTEITRLYIVQALLYVVIATWTEPTSYYQSGDIIIGGIFPLHQSTERKDNYSLLKQPEIPICTNYLFRGFRWMQAFLFAIEEINNSTKLLNGLKLGWKVYDSCDSTYETVSQAMDIIHHNTSSSESVKIVVGPTSSSNSIAVANILGVYDIPQISYGSTTKSLSAKKYNSFLRTIPNDDEQAKAMVDLLTFYNWTWVGVIGSDNEYGRQGLAAFKQEAKGICIEFEEYVSEDMKSDKISDLVERIQNFNATVFVLFMGGTPIKLLSKELNKKGVTGKIWVASEAWATSRSVLESGGSAMHGTLGIATRGGTMNGFRQFLENVSPFTQQENPFVAEFWEKSFKCNCSSDVCATSDPRVSRYDNNAETQCSGAEKFSDLASGNGYLDWTDSELEKSYTAYLAVHAISHALQDIMNCTEGSGLLEGGKCPNVNDLEPWQLLAYIKKVEFTSPGNNENFGFDDDGDPNATYKLVSWVPTLLPNGTSSDDVTFAHVGNYSKQKYDTWSITSTAIYWRDENATQQTEVPSSVCSVPCKPGFLKKNLVSDCCFECLVCPPGQFSNTTNSPVCSNCGDWNMPNYDRTACVSKPEEYMRWDSAFGIVFACASCLGLVITLFTAIIFVRNRNTPIVKATNVEISYLLLGSLAFCYLTPFIYIGKPEDWNCRGRQACFVLSFTFCIACILVKTLRVLTAFQATMPLKSRKRSRWLGEHLQILVVVLISLVQVIICVVWLTVAPPSAEKQPETDRILIVCEVGSLPLMISTIAYLAVLGVAAFVLAFRARKLPENFNEAKFITFSMLVFFIVWSSFVPAYLSTRGVMATALHCIGILASSSGILGCLFFTKLYVILVTPENNTTERLRNATVNHAFRAASKSVIYRINSDKKTTTTTGIGESPCPSPSVNSKTISPSPCVTRLLRQGNPPPSSRLTTESYSCKTNGVNKAMNGKMTKSSSTPRFPTERNSELPSADGTLHVNADASLSRSDMSLNSLANNSEPKELMLSEPEDAEDKVITPSRLGYRRVPSSDKEILAFENEKKLTKSNSCKAYIKSFDYYRTFETQVHRRSRSASS